ncbi:hypothetical protein SSX86_011908 [Deinandra increscens subsp. villosa]|uniref:RING-type E3 ubiquitin transferase n=1 Tax=Deinandra increscens subsp. villosa TaxID=3103831 RepID=A0AAP0H0Z8_9ASTR
MNQVKFSPKFLFEFKQVVVIILALIAAKGFAAIETTNEPPSSVSPSPKTEPKISLHMAILLACLLTTFLLVCLSLFYFCHCVERQLALAAATGYRGERTSMAAARGLDPAVIATFISFSYSAVQDIKIGQKVLECAVCLNEFHEHEALRLLPDCNHVLHRSCIDEWLMFHVTCPVCRASLVPKPGQLSHDSELPYSLNKQTKDHVSVELITLKHDLAPSRKLYRSSSMTHPTVEWAVENVDRYTLRLPNGEQSVVKNSIIDQTTEISLLTKSSMKTSLKCASANFVRGSNYFECERFRQ